VHLSDREFEELVEAREQPWERQIEGDAEAGKLDQLAEEGRKRCVIISKGSASGSRETWFDSQPKILRDVSTSAARP